jgi:hypothetical protein
MRYRVWSETAHGKNVRNYIRGDEQGRVKYEKYGNLRMAKGFVFNLFVMCSESIGFFCEIFDKLSISSLEKRIQQEIDVDLLKQFPVKQDLG